MLSGNCGGSPSPAGANINGAAFEYSRTQRLMQTMGYTQALCRYRERATRERRRPVKIPHLYNGTPCTNPSSISTMSPITWPADLSGPYYFNSSALERKGNFTDWGFPIYAPSTFAPALWSRRQRDLSRRLARMRFRRGWTWTAIPREYHTHGLH